MNMGRRSTVRPDATRRRASTNRRMDGIMELARQLPLTRQVLADQLETATPAQMEFVDRWMNAEIESREASKRARLLRQAGFPAAKELDGYDWENVRMPADWRRSGLESSDSSTGRRTWSCSALPAPARPISPSRWAARHAAGA